MHPEVTVIIPTHNRLATLPRALDSVLSQKYRGGFETRPCEIIVIDDGSTDGTASLVAEKYPQVSYVYQENQGPAAARNRGIRYARSEFIAFLDSDDEWRAGKLQAQLDFFEKNPDFLICQTEEIWIRNGKRVNPMKKHQKYGGFIFEKCLPLCIVSPSAVMMHHRLFEEVGLFDESLPACEDYDLWLRIAARFPIGLIEKPHLTKYGGHADQTSHRYPAMDRFRIQSLTKILASGRLTPEQAAAAQKMLEEKTRIFTQGALKRKQAIASVAPLPRNDVIARRPQADRPVRQAGEAISSL